MLTGALLLLSPQQVLPQCLRLALAPLGLLPAAPFGQGRVIGQNGRLRPVIGFGHPATLPGGGRRGQAAGRSGLVALPCRHAARGTFIDDAGEETGIAGGAAGFHETVQPDTEMGHRGSPATRCVASVASLLMRPHDLPVAGTWQFRDDALT